MGIFSAISNTQILPGIQEIDRIQEGVKIFVRNGKDAIVLVDLGTRNVLQLHPVLFRGSGISRHAQTGMEGSPRLRTLIMTLHSLSPWDTNKYGKSFHELLSPTNPHSIPCNSGNKSFGSPPSPHYRGSTCIASCVSYKDHPYSIALPGTGTPVGIKYQAITLLCTDRLLSVVPTLSYVVLLSEFAAGGYNYIFLRTTRSRDGALTEGLADGNLTWIM